MNVAPHSRLSEKHPREDRQHLVDFYYSWQLCDFFDERQPESATRFVVNVGAGDGKSFDDPCFPLYQRGYCGLAIEGSENADLAKNLPQPEIQKLTCCVVTPMNVAGVLGKAGTPQDLDLLKTDIDGYDGPVLNAILAAGYRPKIIQAEINPEIPPPIEFSVMYHPKYRCLDAEGLYTGFYGMSLAYLARIARRYAYHVAFMDNVTPATHDVVLVRNDLAPSLGSNTAMDSPSLRRRYLDYPLPSHLHFNEYSIDPMRWRHRTDYAELAAEVWNACFFSGVRKHGGLTMPFFLGLAE